MPIMNGGPSIFNHLEKIIDYGGNVIEGVTDKIHYYDNNIFKFGMELGSGVSEYVVEGLLNVGEKVIDLVDQSNVDTVANNLFGAGNSLDGSGGGGSIRENHIINNGGGGSYREDNHSNNGGGAHRSPTTVESVEQDPLPIRLSQSKSSIPTGYPSGKPGRHQMDNRTLMVKDHFKYDPGMEAMFEGGNGDDSYYIDHKGKHFTRDVNDPKLYDMPVLHKSSENKPEVVFSGSTTHINPTNNEEKNDIILKGLEVHETESIRQNSMDENALPPISPIHPFTRMNPSTAQKSNLTTYNRTKLPVADLEFRKGFRHIFFTRPECYIMSRDPSGSLTPILSEQCEYDEDFSSAYSRMPHILKLLSPIYITGGFTQNGINSNWNYLLCNRVMGMTTTPTSLTINENITKSVEGYTITPAMHMESRQGSTLDLKFRDTKNLEVYETLRLWMLYMYKRKKGIFAPPYNEYKYRNGFLLGSNSSFDANGSLAKGSIGTIKPSEKTGDVSTLSMLGHPYDRALEYCCSIFDIVTNESMTKILYWCKYYGAYPISASPDGLSNDLNGPLTNEMTVSSQWKYHYKLENVNKTLVEFNFNAGITDNMGRVNKNVVASYPFLLRDNPEDKMMQQYIGASGMFTGSPYIILGESQNDPLKAGDRDKIVTPYLQFMALNDGALNSELNLGMTNIRTQSPNSIIGIIDPEVGHGPNDTQPSSSAVLNNPLPTEMKNNPFNSPIINDTVVGKVINLVDNHTDVINNTKEAVDVIKEAVNNLVPNGFKNLF